MNASNPKGTRDFSPTVMIRRNYIFDTIKTIFQRYGFMPIETPAMENLSTLTGKYGDEGDKLIFKILNSGDYLPKDNSVILSQNTREITPLISSKALRYDLTVPFARYVVQHQDEITFPFKRYQIQPVWRADRPQKGRYREFYQCDADVIGSTSLLNEVEMIQMIDDVFKKLKVDGVTIKINNRKILAGIVEELGVVDKLIDLTTAIDKLDKIGADNVKKELIEKGFSEEKVNELIKVIFWTAKKVYFTPDKNMDKDSISMAINKRMIKYFRDIFRISNTLKQGLEEMDNIISVFYDKSLLKNIKLVFTPSLARGLNYYTGTILEVTTDDFPGSICGGGRYDDLTGIFGLSDVSGVGISFGADRIYDVMIQRDLFSSIQQSSTQVLFVNFGQKEAGHCLKLLQQLRVQGINAELYPDEAKMKKQMKYANAKGISYVVLVGADEMKQNILSVKNMQSGEQLTLDIEELIKHILSSNSAH